jgi:hypothetical protein
MTALRSSISYAALGVALGLTLATTAPPANAQTVIRPQPVTTGPLVQTTTTTVRTVRTVPVRTVRRQVVTTRTRTVTRSIAPAPVAAEAAPYPQPIYDTASPVSAVAPAPVPAAVAVSPDYAPPLYDVATTRPLAPAIAGPPLVDSGSIVATQPFIYRYVYEPDRILVVDPNTGIAVQSIPR